MELNQMELKTTEGITIFRSPNVATMAELIKEAIEHGVKNFKKADFSHANLSGMLLKDLTFSEAKFSHTNLKRAQFIDCWLDGCTFEACDMFRTIFAGSSMQRSQFSRTHMGHAMMEECTLKGSNLIHLGMSVRGYNFVMTYENGVALIRAGCQEFNLDDAKEHWPESANSEEGAKVTLARRIAHQLGWLPAMLIEGASVAIDLPQEDPVDPPVEEEPVEAPAELPNEVTKEVVASVNA
jgi:hypothetical protein